MRGKQIGIIAVIILVIGAFVIVPMLKGGENEENTIAAKFSFLENLATPFGKKVPLSFEILAEDVTSSSIYLNDSLLKTWQNPKGKITFTLDVSLFGLGAKTISLVSTLANGQEQNDTRMIRIVSDEAPKKLKAYVLKSFVHNPSSFTQGLEFNDGQLFESTGLNDKSKIAQVELESGKITKEIGLDGTYFGEGITILGDKIYQLTWQNQKCFVYDKNSMQLKSEFTYTNEGWGLCNDGKSLIMSNGSEFITFRNPETFQIERTIEVYDQIGPRVRLNELEYINGKIYANIWQLDIVIVIDPKTGKVLQEIDCADVVSAGRGAGEVLNGIAFNSKTNKIYMTGKNWSNLLEVEIK
ncbi:MAG: glutaminyl-peptide cyclotransferase [Flavobacteriia bacterium]|jgi:glutamine cyclotransferase